MKAELSYVAKSYVYNYNPSLKKHCLLKRLRNNKDIVILKPDKGNRVVVLDRKVYNAVLLKIISDTSKFKLLTQDSTLKQEGQL